MPALPSRLSIFLVLGSLVAAVALNAIVLWSCDYLNGRKNDTVELGVWRFSVDNMNSAFDTGGECEPYSDYPEGEDVPATIRTAQVSSVIAPVCGLLLILLVLTNQCCCTVPCSRIFTSLLYTGVHVGTALVWFVARNDVCDEILGGCEWGRGASLNFVAQMLYLFASIMHRCLPDPKERRQEQSKVREGVSPTSEGGNDGDAVATGATVDSSEVTRLQGELDQATQRTDQLQGSLDRGASQLAELQEEHDKTKKALSAATAATSTAAAAEAVEIKQLKDYLEEQQLELEKAHRAATNCETNARDLEEDNSAKEAALVAATAAAATAAAAKAVEIKRLKEELEQKTTLVERLQIELNDLKGAKQTEDVAPADGEKMAEEEEQAKAVEKEDEEHEEDVVPTEDAAGKEAAMEEKEDSTDYMPTDDRSHLMASD